MNVKYETLYGRSPENDEWLTPPPLIEALGEFDLDPCAPVKRPWEMAKNHYTFEDNGLNKEWVGRVFLNPPYGSFTKHWIQKAATHGNCIALIFNRSDTKLFHEYVFPNATAILHLKGRIKFHHVNGIQADSSGSPSVLIAFDDHNARVLKDCQLKGFYIDLKH
jgi:DNA N-6-adenine-methyltransferase (Dam)